MFADIANRSRKGSETTDNEDHLPPEVKAVRERERRSGETTRDESLLETFIWTKFCESSCLEKLGRLGRCTAGVYVHTNTFF